MDGHCIHCGVEVTELSTNKQHTLALKWDSWEDMGFKERFLAWMGRAKMASWGQGALNSRGKRQTNVHESAEKRRARVRTGRSWGELF
jgi:hypothetical protein